jgi:NADP-dependent 3-hydroxy acid dehydrogenase YdfG
MHHSVRHNSPVIGPCYGSIHASELDVDELHEVLRRNLFGTIYTVLAVAPIMKRQRSGKIITVSSQAGSAGSATSAAHYGKRDFPAAAKAAEAFLRVVPEGPDADNVRKLMAEAQQQGVKSIPLLPKAR